MFENLSERLERSFKILKGEGKITEINVAETLKDVRRALLDADVNYKVAKQFTDTVKTKALGQDVLTAVKPGQLMVKIVHDELATLMGGETAEVNLSQNPSIILMSGLQGSGKTTHSAKLAKYLKAQGHRPMLVACDIYRPAAIEQLKVVGKAVDAPVFEMGTEKPEIIAKKAVEKGIITLPEGKNPEDITKEELLKYAELAGDNGDGVAAMLDSYVDFYYRGESLVGFKMYAADLEDASQTISSADMLPFNVSEITADISDDMFDVSGFYFNLTFLAPLIIAILGTMI